MVKNLKKGIIKMKVLSLFDGMSCGQIALQRLGIDVEKYVASEIDKYAISVAKKNFPNMIHVGDVRDVKVTEHFDLIMFGSPCQGFSFAGNNLNFDDPRSKLFFEAVRILEKAKAINPNVKFLMENVRMKKDSEQVITDLLGVEPIAINSRIFSAQSRYRLYWTNLEVGEIPKDKGIVLKDILEDDYITDRDKSHCIDANYFKGGNLKSYFEKHRRQLVFSKDGERKLTPLECERLQTVPDNYTNHVSNTQRYKMIGNGWTIDTICHLLGSLDNKN